jgi:hypothetical protein
MRAGITTAFSTGSTTMANLYEILADAGDGETLDALARGFGLTPRQTEAAASALLPAISTGLKRATATPEGVGNLFSVMGWQEDLQDMHGDPQAALGPEGRAAGNDVLSVIFGTPDVSRAVADHAAQVSGVSPDILKKLLPVLAGIVVSGMMGSKSGQAAPQGAPPTAPGGGGLGDILGQIFGRGAPSGGAPQTMPPQIPTPSRQSAPVPTSPGEEAGPGPGGDLLGYVLRELQKGIQEGRIKPVIIEGGPIQIPMPGGQGGPVQSPAPGPQGGPAPSGPSVPGGDIFGQILRDIFGQAGGGAGPSPQPRVPSPQMKDLSDLSKQLGVAHVGQALFGDHLEAGREVGREHAQKIENIFDRYFGARQR